MREHRSIRLVITEAIVLAGGFGTRLRAVVKDVPKPMAPVRGRPFLEYLLDYLASQGLRKVVLSVGYLSETIEAAFGRAYKTLSLDYVHEHQPLGTGGGIRLALEQTQGDSVLALNGDSYFPVPLAQFCRHHEDRQAQVTLALKWMEHSDRYGTLQLEKDGSILAFMEKGAVAAGPINGGVYAIRRSVLGEFEAGRAFSFERDVLEKHAGSLRMVGFLVDKYFIDIGIPEDYARAQIELPDTAGAS